MHTTRSIPASAASIDGVGGKARRHIDDAGVGAGGLHGLLHRVEDRHGAKDPLAALAGGGTAYDVGAVVDHLLGVEIALAAGDALHEQPCVAVDKNAHGFAAP